jgi:hypothetical protein|uniref:Uncharacterized protein n=1 Tax=Attheya septentrionalis TaxID=420275 RepID=A0A7S2UD15_9STRA|mmetsp:Transcript_17679/g.31943  ORF Transcript_17679/g.31943 Transcript_17679/m.31943 type:complete len:244 (+) Transcript_17679:171-902(+)|eukprot:CAMPEP_0198293596 /NCGR_PEP_ID=MMETSP1449-20131203/17910_1 /TAXON_ID=420275 /ORGANISM="Attheya septentrionalis, Strain CCMP2084" /LENGTH=243 /DNA_ID=CAMNT_0043993235 /DNA_START=164 /DNA_END=895 /DNA_ORIENTATION=-
MTAKTATGKFVVYFLAYALGLGLLISILSPQWVHITAEQDNNTDNNNIKSVFKGRYGPFYGQTKTCDVTSDNVDGTATNLTTCSRWKFDSLDLSDCDALVVEDENNDNASKLCRYLLTWRVMAILTLIALVPITMLVRSAACLQVFTCGCCGSSFDFIAMLLFWFVVLLSIITWSILISSINMMRDNSQVLKAGYMWGFWIYLVSATFLASMCAVAADWASNDSIFRKLYNTIHSKLLPDNKS